jgi:hypothetical protein
MFQLIEAARILVTRAIRPEWNTRQALKTPAIWHERRSIESLVRRCYIRFARRHDLAQDTQQKRFWSHCHSDGIGTGLYVFALTHFLNAKRRPLRLKML